MLIPRRANRRPAVRLTPAVVASARPWAGGCTCRSGSNYRLKNKLLGPPLVRDDMRSERLSNGVALGVLSPDCISSSAYGPEQILRVLVPVVGAGAFTLVMPVTGAILLVLFLVTMSYREVVMVYTKAGGSYAVSRDNFGVRIAQVAAVALLIDYVVTVAVQTSAGADALISAFDALGPYKLEITVAVVVLLTYGNLRGIREAGRAFAAPTYFFIVTLGLVIVIGLIRKATGNLPVLPINVPGAVPPGPSTNGFLMGASVFILLRAFANGGSSLTGLEAISNGVSAFQPPEGPHARRVLVVMSLVLGTLVTGVSLLAAFTHATPYVSGFPTVISQEAQQVFGHSGVGNSMYYVFQAATMLILFTGANTSFNGFPFLASFVAEDSFLPRQLTRRGHRLVFSKGIVALSTVAIAILLATDASVNRLVSVYAIGVFTGFTDGGLGNGPPPSADPRAPLAAQGCHQRECGRPLVLGRPDIRDHEVHGGCLDRRRALPAAGVGADPAQPRVPRRGGDTSRRVARHVASAPVAPTRRAGPRPGPGPGREPRPAVREVPQRRVRAGGALHD